MSLKLVELELAGLAVPKSRCISLSKLKLKVFSFKFPNSFWCGDSHRNQQTRRLLGSSTLRFYDLKLLACGRVHFKM